jgi:hypothetical protein
MALKVSSIPQAHSVKIMWCGDDIECGRPHVVLFDRGGFPIAQFVCPDRRPEGGTFVDDLTEAFDRSELLRGARA